MKSARFKRDKLSKLVTFAGIRPYIQHAMQIKITKGKLLLLLVLIFHYCHAVAAFSEETPKAYGNGGVSENGALSVQGRWLLNQYGKPVVLKGMSSHGVHFYPQFTSKETLLYLRELGTNLFRVAMYTDSNHGGYHQSQAAKERNFYLADLAVQHTLNADMYAIIDWHILRELTPLPTLESAVEFFDRMSKKYANHPGLIYEICNEPNGPTSWEDISEYAKRIIPVIRKNSPDAVIIVGTPGYSKQITKASEAPLPFENIMYALHIYPKKGREETYRVAGQLLQENFPIFISEWGVFTNPGSTEPAIDEALQFLKFMHEHKLSWANWSLCNDTRSHSAIRFGVEKLYGWTEAELTPSGQLVFSAFRWQDEPEGKADMGWKYSAP